MDKKLDNISHGKPSAELNSLKASQSSNSANVRTDIEETKHKLNTLAEKWKGVNSVKGFLTDLWIALGIDAPTQSQQKGGNPSRYAAFQLQDGSVITVTIRASAHNADASNYASDGNINGNSNLSIVLQKRWHKNTFKPNENVNLDEYVYVDSKIAKVENPLSQIASSLVGYLTNGQYVDTTGVAIEHHSPQITKESKLRKYMKKTINENHLRAIVAESVKRVLKEGIMGGAMRNVYNDAKNGYAQGYDNFSDFAKDARDYVKNQDTDFGRERYKQYKQDYKNAPKNSEERGYYAQKALENKPGLGGRITRAASVPKV